MARLAGIEPATPGLDKNRSVVTETTTLAARATNVVPAPCLDLLSPVALRRTPAGPARARLRRENQSSAIEYRYGDGRLDRLRRLVRELTARRVDVLIYLTGGLDEVLARAVPR